MKVIKSLKDTTSIYKHSAIALGTFDGVHIAHQEVIQEMADYAKIHNLLSVVYTFSNHPKEMNSAIETPKKLITPSQKIKIIEKLGIDVLVIVPFDEMQLNIEAEAFLKDILIDQLKAKHITVGYNFRFGRNARGNTTLLKSNAELLGYDIKIVEPIRYHGMIVSSTMIRNFLLNGDVQCANILLGRTYCVEGTVIHGKKVGRKLGFPTINLNTEFEMSVLRPGVYVTQTNVDGKTFYSATNVGFNPTFDQEHFTIETFILNFSEDLYAKHVRVSFLEYVRPEIKFEQINDLIQQIGQDIRYVKSYFDLS